MPAPANVWLPMWWTNESSAMRAPNPCAAARSEKSSSSKLPAPKRSSRPPMRSTTSRLIAMQNPTTRSASAVSPACASARRAAYACRSSVLS